MLEVRVMMARIRSWIAETHGSGFELVRHFLARFFDSEMVTEPGQLKKAAIGALAGLIPAALLVYPMFIRRYGCLAIGEPAEHCPPISDYAAQYFLLVRTDVCWLISLALCITALVTALRWQSLFPSKRDCLALAALPASPRDIFLAKFASLLLAFSVFMVAVNLAPAVLFAMVIVSRWQVNPSILANVLATFAATAGACTFAFFTLLAVQGVLLVTMPSRVFERVSGYAQAVLFTLSVAALPFLWRQPSPSAWWPPNWFLDLRLSVLGTPGASSRDALLAIGAAAALALLTYLASYYRYHRMLLESTQRRQGSRTGLGSRLLEAWIHDPREQGMFSFIWKTLLRSRAHQRVLQICAGLSLAWVVQGVAGLTGSHAPAGEGLLVTVSLGPPVVAVFLVVALRYLFSLPAELPANWLFQTSEQGGREAWLRATDRFVVWCGLLPVYLLSAPAAIAACGWWQAVRLLVLGFAMALVMFEFWFRNWRKAPFTCSHLPGERPLWLLMLIGLGALSFLSTVAFIVFQFSAGWVGFAAFLPLELAAYLKLRRGRRSHWADSRLIYEERPEPAVTSLGIQDERGSEVEVAASGPETHRRAGSEFWNRFREPEEETGTVAFPRGDRAARPFFALTGLAEDVRFGLRLLRRNMLLSGSVLVTLALGIGMNVSVLTLINGFALRARADHPNTFARVALPYAAGGSFGVGRATPDEYLAYRDRSRTLSALAAFSTTTVTLGNDRSQEAGALLVSCNFFEVYELPRAKMGRLFFPYECGTPGQTPVAVLSEEAWRDRFAANPQVIGKTIAINDQAFTVVGVVPARHPSRVARAAVWIPYTAQPLIEPGADMFRNQAAVLILDGRLAPGISRGTAQAEMQVIAHQLDAAHPGRKTTLAVTDGSLLSMLVSGTSTFVALALMAMGAPWAVLLITCANVTTLLLSRAVSRRREVAVRLALGAPRMRLLRMLLVESCLLAALAGSAAWYIAHHVPAMLYQFLTREPPGFPVAPDWRIFAFVFGVVLAIGCLAGLAPAFESLKVDLTASLKGYESDAAGFRGGVRIRSLLVSSQIALGLVLLVCAGLVGQMNYQKYGLDRGFDTLHLLDVPLRFPAHSTPGSSQALYRNLDTRLRSLPMVRAVAYGDDVPFLGNAQRIHVPEHEETERAVMVNAASPGYLNALGIPIVAGRDLREGDEPSDSGVIRTIVSQSFARTFFRDRYPVGQRLQMGPHIFLEVIGMAKDVNSSVEDRLAAYTLPNWNSRRTNLLVRFTGDARGAVDAVRSVIRDANPALLVMPATLQAVFDEGRRMEGRLVLLLMILAAVALVLAIAGIYGVVAFSVSQRTRELGIRAALGATRVDIFREVLVTGARPVGYGLFIGVWLSLLVEGLVKSTFGNSPLQLQTGNPMVYLGAASLLALAALGAMLGPARRGALSDPMKALHYE